MSERARFSHTEVKGPREDAARTGADMFIAVSGEYPASVACQASKIAILCKDGGYNPIVLGSDVLADPNAVTRIIRAANNAHEKHGKKSVTPKRVKEIIYGVFKFADTAMPLNTGTLQRILSEYPEDGMDVSTENALQSKIRSLTSYIEYLA